MSPNLPSNPSFLPATNVGPNVANIAPNALPVAPAMPNALTGTQSLMQAASSKVGVLNTALRNTSTGLLALLGPVAMLGLTFFALKAIIKGENPLK